MARAVFGGAHLGQGWLADIPVPVSSMLFSGLWVARFVALLWWWPWVARFVA